MITVVVVLHDSAAHLRHLLASLPRGLQLVVVDTGSGDDGPALARAHGAEVVELPDNPGFGAANNAGVARARHAVCALVNPDCVVPDGALERLAELVRRHDVLAVPRLLSPDGSVQDSAHPLPGRPGALLHAVAPAPLLPRPVRERAQPWRSKRRRTVGWAIAACVVARTATLRALGPFDPAQFLFFEDLDLCLRARAHGIPTVLAPDIHLHHEGGHSTRKAYAGEPHALLAQRRRSVVQAGLGARARRMDDLTQALTFAVRAPFRRRAREQLRAQLRR